MTQMGQRRGSLCSAMKSRHTSYSWYSGLLTIQGRIGDVYFFFFFHVIACVYMCILMYRQVYACRGLHVCRIGVHIHACGGQGTTSGVTFRNTRHLLLRQGFLALSSPVRLDWLAVLQKSSCLCFPDVAPYLASLLQS